MREEDLVALLAFLIFVPILAALYLRYRQKLMLHQERMSAIEKGTSIPLGREPAPWSPRVYLLRGLIWSFSGAALIVCLLGLAWASSRPQSATLVAMRAREISRSLEIPIDQARQIAEKDGAAAASTLFPSRSPLHGSKRRGAWRPRGQLLRLRTPRRCLAACRPSIGRWWRYSICRRSRTTKWQACWACRWGR